MPRLDYDTTEVNSNYTSSPLTPIMTSPPPNYDDDDDDESENNCYGNYLEVCSLFWIILQIS